MSEPRTPSSKELANDDLDRLVEHLKAQEVSAEDATLSSVESLQLWIMSHPGLQQPGIYELINQYGPAILQMIKKLIGL